MAVTNYHTVNGEIVGETTSGVRTDYLVDALGSVTGTVNQSAQVLNTYRYKPYGALLAKTGTAADPKSQWVGTLGYRPTGRAQSDYYVRARHYGVAPGRWTTVDPLWPKRPKHGYPNPASVVDAGGTGNDGNGNPWDQIVPGLGPVQAGKRRKNCEKAVNQAYKDCLEVARKLAQGEYADDIACIVIGAIIAGTVHVVVTMYDPPADLALFGIDAGVTGGVEACLEYADFAGRKLDSDQMVQYCSKMKRCLYAACAQEEKEDLKEHYKYSCYDEAGARCSYLRNAAYPWERYRDCYINVLRQCMSRRGCPEQLLPQPVIPGLTDPLRGLY